VKFREIPWQMLLLGFLSVSLLLSFPCNSVASLLLLLGLISVKFRVRPWLMLLLLLGLISVFFRVNPWQMLLLGFPLILPSVSNASAFSSFRG
jgi:hypothetical protein